ncbi:GTP-binding protein [Francisella halioticida]
MLKIVVKISWDIIEHSDEDILELQNGCICCTIRADLTNTLLNLIDKTNKGVIKPFDRVIVETTGLADLAPIIHTLMRSFELHRYYKLDDIVTLVDAVNGNDTLDNHPEATKQAAMAERIILSKTDIVDSNTQQTLINRLKAINPSTPILFNTSDEAIVSSLSGLDTYNPNSKSEDVIKWLNMEHFEDEHQHLHHNHSDEDHDHDHHHDINRHSDEIQAFVMTSDKPINYMAFNLFLELLTSMVGLKLLRVKGIINIVGEDRPVVVHGVQHLFHPIRWLDNWPDDDHRTRLVFITHNIPQEVIQKLFNSLLGTVKEEGIE